MYGLEAISAHNGWAISVVGISSVFVGLVMLSSVIAQLHKVLDLWENPSKIKTFFKAKKQKENKIIDIKVLSQSQKETAKQFALLARTMEDHFSLPRLLYLAQISGLNDPHSNLNNLIGAEIIVPDGLGFFTWDKDKFDQTISYQS